MNNQQQIITIIQTILIIIAVGILAIPAIIMNYHINKGYNTEQYMLWRNRTSRATIPAIIIISIVSLLEKTKQ